MHYDEHEAPNGDVTSDPLPPMPTTPTNLSSSSEERRAFNREVLSAVVALRTRIDGMYGTNSDRLQGLHNEIKWVRADVKQLRDYISLALVDLHKKLDAALDVGNAHDAHVDKALAASQVAIADARKSSNDLVAAATHEAREAAAVAEQAALASVEATMKADALAHKVDGAQAALRGWKTLGDLFLKHKGAVAIGVGFVVTWAVNYLTHKPH